jgi:hypothetical protein
MSEQAKTFSSSFGVWWSINCWISPFPWKLLPYINLPSLPLLCQWNLCNSPNMTALNKWYNFLDSLKERLDLLQKVGEKVYIFRLFIFSPNPFPWSGLCDLDCLLSSYEVYDLCSSPDAGPWPDMWCTTEKSGLRAIRGAASAETVRYIKLECFRSNK